MKKFLFLLFSCLNINSNIIFYNQNFFEISFIFFNKNIIFAFNFLCFRNFYFDFAKKIYFNKNIDIFIKFVIKSDDFLIKSDSLVSVSILNIFKYININLNYFIIQKIFEGQCFFKINKKFKIKFNLKRINFKKQSSAEHKFVEQKFTKKQTAYHEIGHAIIAYNNKAKIEKIDIIGDNHNLNNGISNGITHTKLKKRVDLKSTLILIKISLAGMAAEELFYEEFNLTQYNISLVDKLEYLLKYDFNFDLKDAYKNIDKLEKYLLNDDFDYNLKDICKLIEVKNRNEIIKIIYLETLKDLRGLKIQHKIMSELLFYKKEMIFEKISFDRYISFIEKNMKYLKDKKDITAMINFLIITGDNFI